MDFDGLLVRARAGDEAARSELFVELRRLLRMIAIRRLRGGLAAWVDDTVQDTLLIVSRRLEEIDDHPHRYALVVLKNRIGQIYRDPRRYTSISTDDGGPEESVEPVTPDPLLRERMEDAFARLGPQCRDLIAHLARGRSRAEICALYPGVSSNAMGVRIHRCRGEFRSLLGVE